MHNKLGEVLCHFLLHQFQALVRSTRHVTASHDLLIRVDADLVRLIMADEMVDLAVLDTIDIVMVAMVVMDEAVNTDNEVLLVVDAAAHRLRRRTCHHLERSSLNGTIACRRTASKS